MAKKMKTKVLLGVLLVLAVCTSMSSAQGGKEFYLAFMEWHPFQYPNLRSMAVSLTNPNNASVQVYVDLLGLSEPQQVRILAAGEFVTLEFTHNVSMDSGSGKYQKSVRISSSDDIFVQANPEYNQPSVTASASGFAVLPTHLLTSDYIVATHCKTEKCVFAVTSAEDGNTVQVHFQITSSTIGKAGYGEILYEDDSVLYESLDKGETMQVTCNVCDMTGTWVTSSKKVAVFAGGTFTMCDGSRSRRDAVAEQMMPTERLGTSYVLGSNLFAPILREKIKVVLLCVGDSFTYGGNVYTATRDRHRFVLSKRDMASVATISGTNKMLVAELMCGLNNLDLPDVSMSIALPQESWSVGFVGYVPYLDSSLPEDSAFISLVVPASVQPDWIEMGNVSEVNVTTDGDYTLLCLRYTEYGLKELQCTHPKCKSFWGFVTHNRKLRSSVYSLTPVQTGLEPQTSLPTCHATTVTWGSTSNDDSTTRTTTALQVPNSSPGHSDTPPIQIDMTVTWGSTSDDDSTTRTTTALQVPNSSPGHSDTPSIQIAMTVGQEITTQNNVTTQNDVDDKTPSTLTSTVTTTENIVVTTAVSAKALDDTISVTADNESNFPIQSVSVTQGDMETSSDVSAQVVSHQAEVTSTNIMTTHSERTTAVSVTAPQNIFTTQMHTATDDGVTTQSLTTNDDDVTTQSHTIIDDDVTTQRHTTINNDDVTTYSRTTIDDEVPTQNNTTIDDDVTVMPSTLTSDVGYTEISTVTQNVPTSELVSDTPDATDNGNNLFIQSLSTTETEKTTYTDVNDGSDVTTPSVLSSAAHTEGDVTSQTLLRTEPDTVTPDTVNMNLTTLSTETVITTTALSNSYSDVITQNVTTSDVNTTTQQNTYTPANNNNNQPSSRRCQCVKNGDIPEEEKKAITKNVTAVMKRYLAEDRKNMSAYIRTKISAGDERISPLIIGTTLGIVTCVVVILVFPVTDLLRHAFYLY